MSDDPQPTPATAARLLLRSARSGALATATDGQPFNSLATPAPAPDGSVLLLLSELSEHTRHLRVEPRCSLLLVGDATSANPQTSLRLTITGLAALEPDEAMKQRWVARHPYAAFYAGFGDFHLWRIQPAGGLFIGGFASATRLRQADLRPDPAAVAAILEAEPSVLEHCNADHGDALQTIAAHHGGPPGAWSMAACDVDGCDLQQDETVLRVAWPVPVSDANGIRKALIALARDARAADAGRGG